HLPRGLLRDGAIEMKIIAVPASKQFTNGQARGLAENVPAGNVDAALDIGMPFEDCVHLVIEPGDLVWVFADQMRCQFAQSSSHALGVGRKIEGTERTDFAVTDRAG